MTGRTFYLSSLESARFEPVRECRVETLLTFDTGKAAVRARLSLPVVGQDFGRGADIETVILAARHEGVSVDRITEFPCFVFIVIPRSDVGVVESPVRADELEIIGWGELYRTAEDARRHAFG
jgi:hypothetical protein